MEERFGNIEEIESGLIQTSVNGNKDVDSYELKEQVKRYSDNTKHRKNLVCWVMWVIPCWLGFVLLAVFLSGTNCFELKENVLITMLTTTTINILGLPLIILRGLFKH